MRELSCHNLCFERPASAGGARTILEGITCSFRAGTVTLITGPTGAGKSTLVHLLACLMRPTSGEVKADGEQVSRWVTAHKDLWRRKIGIIFQQPRLMKGLTVLENLMLPLVPRRMILSEMRGAGLEALRRIEAHQFAGKDVGTLSGGERQKVAVAIAMVGQAEAILADEPTAHQDDQSTDRLVSVLRQAATDGAIVVIASHDSRLRSPGIADQYLTIQEGRMHETGCCTIR
jgi:putative ABC transport system ATP-binding protein